LFVRFSDFLELRSGVVESWAFQKQTSPTSNIFERGFFLKKIYVGYCHLLFMVQKQKQDAFEKKHRLVVTNP